MAGRNASLAFAPTRSTKPSSTSPIVYTEIQRKDHKQVRFYKSVPWLAIYFYILRWKRPIRATPEAYLSNITSTTRQNNSKMDVSFCTKNGVPWGNWTPVSGFANPHISHSVNGTYFLWGWRDSNSHAFWALVPILDFEALGFAIPQTTFRLESRTLRKPACLPFHHNPHVILFICAGRRLTASVRFPQRRTMSAHRSLLSCDTLLLVF